MACIRFLAHLVNQQVAHEVVALELLTLLLERPTDDSVEMAVAFVKECGQALTELSPKGTHAIFERFRSILHEGGGIDKRVQYMIEGLFAVRKSGFSEYPALVADLDLVEMDDQYTHEIDLADEQLETEDRLNVFQYDDKFEEHQKEYEAIRREILGEDEDEDEDAEEEDDDDQDEQEDEEEQAKRLQIEDQTDQSNVQLRRSIYLTIMSSLDFEECAHKLCKIKLLPGQEKIVTKMILECCMQERTFLKFYGLLGERFCRISAAFQDGFDDLFAIQVCPKHVVILETRVLLRPVMQTE